MLQDSRDKVTLSLLLLGDVSTGLLRNLGKRTEITDSIRHGGTNEC